MKHQRLKEVSFTHPTWKGSFVDVPGLGYMYSVDEDDEGVDKAMIGNWFTKAAIQLKKQNFQEVQNNVKISNND